MVLGDDATWFRVNMQKIYNCHGAKSCRQKIPSWWPEKHQVSDVHSSSATRSRLGSDASSGSTTVGSAEGLPVWSGTMNCGWTDTVCGTEAALPPPSGLPSDPATTDVDSEAIAALLCCRLSVFSCTTDADDDATLELTPNSVSSGITTCLYTIHLKSKVTLKSNLLLLLLYLRLLSN